MATLVSRSGGWMSAIKSPFKAATQSIFDLRQLFRWPVAGDDDLTQILMQRIESVEELFLGALLVNQELDIVDQQHVHRSGTSRESWSSGCTAAR